MNTPCQPFNGIDVLNDEGRFRSWDDYPEQFKAERLAYIKTHDFGEKVFVHGDLCLDNILLSPAGELYIIDFADAVLAPIIYEHALMAFAFEFDPALIQGYFGDYTLGRFADMCVDGLLIHDFGGDIIRDYLENISGIDNLRDLRKLLIQKINSIKGVLHNEC